ncbi:MAG: SprT family zinc-dependent metalloprotease [Rikenellaceae bacterium]
MECEVVWDKYLIKYFVSYKARKTLGISVMPDKSVCVQAPIDSAKEEIEKRIIKRAGWIVKQWQYFDSFGEAMPERRYISGESHYYLGRQYMLKVEEGKPNSVKYKGRCFEVVCTPKSKAKELMNGWYRERAKVKFAEIAEPIIARYARYGVEPSSIYIQEMTSRWGSCTQGGKVILNTELVKMPKPCIEYVITHELTHLIHRNHTKAFYDLLEAEMPDWKRWKDKLERFL